MPFSEWPGAIFPSSAPAEVALAQPPRADAPVLTLPTTTPKRGTTRVIPLDDATTDAPSAPAASTPRRSATRLPKSISRAPKTDDAEPRRKPTTTTPAAPAPAAPAAVAASPAAEQGPTQPAAPATPAARRVKLGDVSTSFASANHSQSGQPELKVQMAVADDTQTAQTRTVSLSLKLAPTDIQALQRNAALTGSSAIALETEVDVVDSTVASAGPACADGTCLRVQMKFAQDTRTAPADQPEVSLSEDGDAISNRVKVVVKIDAEDLGTRPSQSGPAQGPAPDAGTPSVLSLPLPAVDPDPTSPDAPAAPSTDTTTVALPDAAATPGAPAAPAVQVQAQLQVVDTPVTTPAPTPEQTQTTQSDTSGATSVTSPAADDANDCN
jgi:hypothetical protein